MRSPEHRVTICLATSVAALVGACGSEPVILPTEPDARGTVVLIDRVGIVSATALEGDGAGFEVAADLGEDLSAHILYYADGLGPAGLTAGELVAAAPGAPWRPLPMFDRAKLVTITDGQNLGFESVFELRGAAKNFHLSLLDAIACVAAGGCASDGTESAGCATPCPAPSTPAPPIAPAMPAPPSSPVLTPCGLGWTTTPAFSETVCVPAPRVGCLRSDEAQFIDSTGCVPFDSCAADPYATDLPAGTTVYVDGAAVGGDGSLANPFSTLSDALASNAEVIALARGDYASAPVDRAVTVVGRCQGLTTLTGDLAIGAAVSLRRVTIMGGEVNVASSASLDIERAAIVASTDDGIESAGTLHARTLMIAGARRVGARITGGTSRFDRLLIVGAGTGGVRATDTSSVGIHDFVIEAIGATTELEGRGIFVQEGSQATCTNGLIERATSRGIAVEGAEIILRDVAIRRTESAAVSDRGGAGIVAEGASTVSVRRVFIDETKAAAILIGGASVATISDVAVRNVVSRVSDQADGQGLLVKERSFALVERVRIEQATQSGISVDGDGSRATLRDVLITNTRSTPGRLLGHGISIYNGADAELRRVRLENNHHRGLEVTNHSSARVEDISIFGTQCEDLSSEAGQGAYLTDGSTVTIERLLARDNHTAGVEFDDGGLYEAADVTVSGTLPPCNSGYEPHGIKVRGGTATLRRISLIDNTHGGLTLEHDGVLGQIDDLAVSGSSIEGVKLGNGGRASGRRWAITDNGASGINLSGISRLTVEDLTITGARGGSRLAVGITVDFAVVSLERFKISDNESFGITFNEGDLDLVDGEISGQRVGIAVPLPSYNMARLTHHVTFDNERDIDR